MNDIARELTARPLRHFEPYPAYKESGVEWLGAVPAHWKQSKVKFLGDYVNGYPFRPENWSMEGLPIIRIQNLTDPTASFNRFAETIDSRYRVRSGDILISWSASLGVFIWTREEDGWLNQHIFKVQLDEQAVTRDFFVWLGAWFIRELQKETHGSTMTHLTWGRFGGFRVEIPPPREQRIIAEFLDRETARIDALVAKKERLIELLQEKRTALITRAVTKGLDPTVPVKDPGVEWLGEIPDDWEVVSLKRRAKRIQTGTTPPTAEAKYYDDGVIAWYGPGSFVDALPLQEPIKCIAWSAVRDGVARVFDAGSTVVVTIGATIGKVAFMTDAGSFNQQITGVTFDEQHVAPKYGAYQLKRLEPVLRGIAPNTTLPILDKEQVGRLPFVVPPSGDQRIISDFLDRETARIDALIARVREASARLEELRTALISAAVTGKIDVREEVVA